MGCSGKLNMVVFLMVMGVAALQLHTSTAQTTHVVLDSSGWTIPPSGAAAYTAWASNKTFTVGDTLVFNFPVAVHTVAEVTKAAFDACTTTGPLPIWNTPPARVTLNSSGEHYYLCTITGHCAAGQKLAVNVTAAASTPPPAPTPSPPATPPPSPTPSPVATPPPAAAPSPKTTPPPSPSPSPKTTPPPSPSGPSPSPSSGATPPAPSSGATPPAPGSNATPSSQSPAGVTAPPPPNSAASFAAAAFPVTFLSVVIALFY